MTSAALLQHIAWGLRTFGENEIRLLLGLTKNERTIVEKNLKPSLSTHISCERYHIFHHQQLTVYHPCDEYQDSGNMIA